MPRNSDSRRAVPSLLALLLSIGGCSERSERSVVLNATESSLGQVTPGASVQYKAIQATSMSLREMGLCELAKAYNAGAGLYRVGKMTGVVEKSGPNTYVELELLEAWSPSAPGNPTVRIPGGPTADGMTALWLIDAHEGEVLGVLLSAPRAGEGDVYRLYPLGVFHDVGGGYTNGQLFTTNPVSPKVLGEIVGSAVAADGSPDCPDRQPDRQPENVPAEDGIIGPEVKGIDGTEG
jgi:hypothetical protein